MVRVRRISRHGDCPYGELLQAERLRDGRRGRIPGISLLLLLLRLLRLLLRVTGNSRRAPRGRHARRTGRWGPTIALTSFRDAGTEQSNQRDR